MPAPANILLITWPGGGNVHPLVALATRLIARGHRVRAFADAELKQRFEADGVAFRAHRTPSEWAHGDVADIFAATPEQRIAIHRGLAADIAAEVARERPDVLIVDFMQPDAVCAAEATGVPVVAFVHTLYARFAMTEFSPMDFLANREHISLLRDDLGLPRVERTIEILDRCARVLITTVPEFDQPETPIPENARYVGPIVEDPGPDAAWTSPWPDTDVPLVVVGLGTTSMDELPVYQRVLDALADLPVHTLATIGDHITAGDLRIPSNAVVSSYVRHAAVLPHARLFITHSGLSGISTALTLGVPMLCIPLGRDQPLNARQVRSIGAGRALPPDVSVADIRDRAASLLADEATFAAARSIASVIATYGNGARAVAEIEALL